MCGITATGREMSGNILILHSWGQKETFHTMSRHCPSSVGPNPWRGNKVIKDLVRWCPSGFCLVWGQAFSSTSRTPFPTDQSIPAAWNCGLWALSSWLMFTNPKPGDRDVPHINKTLKRPKASWALDFPESPVCLWRECLGNSSSFSVVCLTVLLCLRFSCLLIL